MRARVVRACAACLGIALLSVASAARSSPQPGDWTGTWLGGIRTELEWSAAKVELRESNGKIVGELDAPALDVRHALVELHVDGDSLRLSIEHESFAGVGMKVSLDDGALRSSSDGGWGTPALQLFRPAPLSAAELAACAGWYEIEPGADVLVTQSSEAGLRFFSDDSGGTLLPLSRDRFVVAFKDAQASPPRIDVRFVRDAAGSVQGFELDDGEDNVEARRVREDRARIERISFRNGALELGGVLLTPSSDAPSPAVVFIAGTGYSTADRSYEMSLAKRLLAKGIAVLLFDKRGCGASGGDWRTSTLAELADDAIAAARSLLRRKELDPKAIGLWGVSEGGWIAPLAASKCPELAFIIDHGGPAVPPLEDELDDLTVGIKSAGFQGDELEIAMTLARALVELYRSHDALPSFEAALERARSRPWFARFSPRIPQREDDWRVQWWRMRGQHDSLATWKTLRLPALVVIGGEDPTMDRPKNLALYEGFRASNPRLEIRVVPGADHGLRSNGELVESAVDGICDWVLRVRRK